MSKPNVIFQSITLRNAETVRANLFELHEQTQPDTIGDILHHYRNGSLKFPVFTEEFIHLPAGQIFPAILMETVLEQILHETGRSCGSGKRDFLH